MQSRDLIEGRSSAEKSNLSSALNQLEVLVAYPKTPNPITPLTGWESTKKTREDSLAIETAMVPGKDNELVIDVDSRDDEPNSRHPFLKGLAGSRSPGRGAPYHKYNHQKLVLNRSLMTKSQFRNRLYQKAKQESQAITATTSLDNKQTLLGVIGKAPILGGPQPRSYGQTNQPSTR